MEEGAEGLEEGEKVDQERVELGELAMGLEWVG